MEFRVNNSFVASEPPKFRGYSFNQILFTFFSTPQISFNWEIFCWLTNKIFFSQQKVNIKKLTADISLKKYLVIHEFWWFGCHEWVTNHESETIRFLEQLTTSIFKNFISTLNLVFPRMWKNNWIYSKIISSKVLVDLQRTFYRIHRMFSPIFRI